ncbi:MAG: hypothetical protein RL607_1237 [Bacteroidota bacterium]|jgi:hypothetical protein
MIVILGTKTYLHHSATFQENCTHCHLTQVDFELQLYCDYTYLTFIPLFPVKRHGKIHCTHCKASIEYAELPQTSKSAVDFFAHQKRYFPIWTFTGSVVLLVAISLFIKDWYVKSHTDHPLEQFQKGDVVLYETENGYYSTFKILERKGSVFEVVRNDYTQDTYFYLNDLNISSNYNKLKESLTLKDLNAMEDKGRIEEIKKSNLNSY